MVSKRISKLAKNMLLQMKDTSMPAFSLGVAEEFILISGVTVFSVALGSYVTWFNNRPHRLGVCHINDRCAF